MAEKNDNPHVISFLKFLQEAPPIVRNLVSHSPAVRLRAARELAHRDLEGASSLLVLLGANAQMADLAYSVINDRALHLKVMKTMKQLPVLKKMISTHTVRAFAEREESALLYDVRKCLMELKSRGAAGTKGRSHDRSRVYPLVQTAESLQRQGRSFCNDCDINAEFAYLMLKNSYTLYTTSKRAQKMLPGSSLKFWENYGVRMARNIAANKTFLLSVIPENLRKAQENNNGNNVQQALGTTVSTFLQIFFGELQEDNEARYRLAMITQLIPFIGGPSLLTVQTFNEGYSFASTVTKALVPIIGSEYFMCAIVCYAKNVVWLLAFLANCKCDFACRSRALLFLGYVLRADRAANVAQGVKSTCRQMQKLLQYGIDKYGAAILAKQRDYDGLLLETSYYCFDDNETDKELATHWAELSAKPPALLDGVLAQMVRHCNICFPIPRSDFLLKLKVKPWVARPDDANRILWLFFCACNEYGPTKHLSLPMELIRIVHGFLVGANFNNGDYSLRSNGLRRQIDGHFVY